MQDGLQESRGFFEVDVEDRWCNDVADELSEGVEPYSLIAFKLYLQGELDRLQEMPCPQNSLSNGRKVQHRDAL